jgi:hypothetical protein
MPHDPAALAESVSASFRKLHVAAGTLNNVSDELGKSITRIDESLRKLNLGITAWVEVSSWEEDDGFDFTSEGVGYAKIKGNWGICLRKVEGNRQYPDRDSVELWAFNDAPRIQRLKALDKIPDLLQNLSDEAAKITLKLQARLADVQIIADTVSPRPMQRLPIRPGTGKTEALVEAAADMDRIREAVGAALEREGHNTAAVLLGAGKWLDKGETVEVEVGMGKKMLSLTMNPEAEKISREALRAIGVTRKLVVFAGEGGVK